MALSLWPLISHIITFFVPNWIHFYLSSNGHSLTICPSSVFFHVNFQSFSLSRKENTLIISIYNANAWSRISLLLKFLDNYLTQSKTKKQVPNFFNKLFFYVKQVLQHILLLIWKRFNFEFILIELNTSSITTGSLNVHTNQVKIIVDLINKQITSNQLNLSLVFHELKFNMGCDTFSWSFLNSKLFCNSVELESTSMKIIVSPLQLSLKPSIYCLFNSIQLSLNNIEKYVFHITLPQQQDIFIFNPTTSTLMFNINSCVVSVNVVNFFIATQYFTFLLELFQLVKTPNNVDFFINISTLKLKFKEIMNDATEIQNVVNNILVVGKTNSFSMDCLIKEINTYIQTSTQQLFFCSFHRIEAEFTNQFQLNLCEFNGIITTLLVNTIHSIVLIQSSQLSKLIEHFKSIQTQNTLSVPKFSLNASLISLTLSDDHSDNSNDDIHLTTNNFNLSSPLTSISVITLQYHKKNIIITDIQFHLIKQHLNIKGINISLSIMSLYEITQKVQHIFSHNKQGYIFRNYSDHFLSIKHQQTLTQLPQNSTTKINNVGELEIKVGAKHHYFLFPPFSTISQLQHDLFLHYQNRTATLYTSALIQNQLNHTIQLDFKFQIISLPSNEIVGIPFICLNNPLRIKIGSISFHVLVSSLNEINDTYVNPAHSFSIIKSTDNPLTFKLVSTRSICNFLPFPITVKSINHININRDIDSKSKMSLFPNEEAVKNMVISISSTNYNINVLKQTTINFSNSIIKITNTTDSISFSCDTILTNESGQPLLIHFQDSFFSRSIFFNDYLIINDLNDIRVGMKDTTIEKLNDKFILKGYDKEFSFITTNRSWVLDVPFCVCNEVVISSAYKIGNKSKNPLTIRCGKQQYYITPNQTISLQGMIVEHQHQIQFGVLDGFETKWTTEHNLDTVFTTTSTIPFNNSVWILHAKNYDNTLWITVDKKCEWTIFNDTPFLIAITQVSQQFNIQSMPCKIHKKTTYSFSFTQPFIPLQLSVKYYYKSVMNELDPISLPQNNVFVRQSDKFTFNIKVIRNPPLVIVSNKLPPTTVQTLSISSIIVEWDISILLANVKIIHKNIQEDIPVWCRSEINLSRTRKVQFQVEKSKVLVGNIEVLSSKNLISSDITLLSYIPTELTITLPTIFISLSKNSIQTILNFVKSFPTSSSNTFTIICPITINPFNVVCSYKEYAMLDNISFQFPCFVSEQLPCECCILKLSQFYKNQITKQMLGVATRVIVDNFPVELFLELLSTLLPTNGK